MGKLIGRGNYSFTGSVKENVGFRRSNSASI